MPTYMESEIPTVISTNGGGGFGNSGFGGDGWWGIVLLAVLFGWGRNGQGFGGYGSGTEMLGYELGKVATTNDVASGFNNSAVLSNLNGLKEGQLQMINYNNQGFAGLNSVISSGFAGVDNAICTLGYQNQQGFNTLAHQLSDCCCKTQASIADLKYANERQTSDINTAINDGNQRIIDMYTSDKIDTLNRKLSSAENALNQCQNNAYLINQIKPCPVPSYNVPNPFCCNTTNGCCGCGNF